MKNLKLLLATTAMLSTALAMNVKADGPLSAQISIKAMITGVSPIISEKQALDFGAAYALSGETDRIVKVDSSGSYTDSTAHIVIAPKRGEITISKWNFADPTPKLNFTSSVILGDCGTVDNFAPGNTTCVIDDTTHDYTCNIPFGATWHIPAGSSPKTCNGNVTVTLVKE